jgi:hypothetical protein
MHQPRPVRPCNQRVPVVWKLQQQARRRLASQGARRHERSLPRATVRGHQPVDQVRWCAAHKKLTPRPAHKHRRERGLGQLEISIIGCLPLPCSSADQYVQQHPRWQVIHAHHQGMPWERARGKARVCGVGGMEPAPMRIACAALIRSALHAPPMDAPGVSACKWHGGRTACSRSASMLMA